MAFLVHFFARVSADENRDYDFNDDRVYSSKFTCLYTRAMRRGNNAGRKKLKTKNKSKDILQITLTTGQGTSQELERKGEEHLHHSL